jgi:hypothetical protein
VNNVWPSRRSKERGGGSFSGQGVHFWWVWVFWVFGFWFSGFGGNFSKFQVKAKEGGFLHDKSIYFFWVFGLVGHKISGQFRTIFLVSGKQV